MIENVVKRDGRLEKFNPLKIEKAVSAAFTSVGRKLPDKVIESFVNQVIEDLPDPCGVEEIQNKVENELMRRNCFSVAKAYILYREKHKTIRDYADKNIAFIDNFIKSDNTANATIDDNSNVSNHNIAVLNAELHKEDNQKINYRLLEEAVRNLYPDFDYKQMEKDFNSIMYLHDSSSQVGMPYCVAVTMYPFLLNGIKDLGGLSAKPNSLESFCGIFINMVFAIAAQFKGACMHYKQPLLVNNKLTTPIELASTIKGWVPFESEGQLWEMAIPQEKLTISEEKRKVEIKKLYRRLYNKPLYKVTTNTGLTCTVTEDHIFKVLVKNRVEEIKAKDLALYDTVFINKDLSRYLDIESPEYKRNFCLGMLLGDGCLTTEDAVQLSIGYKDSVYIDIFNSYSEEIFGYSLNVNKGHKCHNLQKHNREYKDSIMRYLVGSRTEDKNIKREYLNSLEEICGFLDGIMSSDGCYRHSYGISLINKELIDSIKYCLNFLHIPYTYKIEKAHDNKKTLYNISFSSCAKPYLVNFVKKCKQHKGANYVYYLGSKAKACTNKEDSYYDTSRRGGNKFGTSSELDVITSIELIENDHPYVYELETDSHWYSCGGIITHNCATPGVFIAMDYFCRREWGDNYHEKADISINSDICNRRRTIKEQILQYFQQITYSINQPASARGGQSVFWNVSVFDKEFYDTMYGDFRYPDGTAPQWESFNWLQKLYMHWLNQERLKCILTFPVLSVALIYKEGKFVDEELYEYTCKEYAEGNSFFTYINDSPESLSSCCRLSSKLSKPQFNFTNGQIGEMTGSKNVITLNLNRITQDWYNSLDSSKPFNWDECKDNFKEYLCTILDRVYKYQTAYNACLMKLYNAGLLTVYTAGFIDLKKQYLTIGINGLNQAAEFLGMECNKNTQYEQFCNCVFSTIKEQNTLHKTKELMFNTEFTPCESAAIKMYNRDKKDGYWVPEDTNLYASYIYKPNDTHISLLDKIYLHGKSYCGDNLDGGSAAHLNLEKHLSYEQYLKILKYAGDVGCKYLTFNVVNSECEDCHYIAKEPFDTCPKCGSKKVSHYDRVIGYLTKISNWSKGRQEEQKTRVYEKI